MIQYINLKLIKSKCLTFIIFILSSFFLAHAQHSEEFNALKVKYPESSFIRLVDEINISITLKNDELEIKQHYIEEDLYLDESATYNSKRALDFSAFFELESVEATSFHIQTENTSRLKLKIL